MNSKALVIKVSKIEYDLLAALINPEFGLKCVEDVIEHLISNVHAGVYRPGSWERPWLCQAFGDDFTKNLEPGDPYGRPNCEAIFVKPKPSKRSGGGE